MSNLSNDMLCMYIYKYIYKLIAKIVPSYTDLQKSNS